jgi:transposase-like protein
LKQPSALAKGPPRRDCAAGFFHALAGWTFGAKTTYHILRAGQMLNQKWTDMGRGLKRYVPTTAEWSAYLMDNLSMERRTADRMMNAAREFPPDPAISDYLDVSAAYVLSRPSADLLSTGTSARPDTPPAASNDVRQGTRDDAAWFALGANKANGHRLSNADKQRAVRRALVMRPGQSNNSIAELVGVSDSTVKKYRDELVSNSQIGECSTVTTSDGRQYPARREPAPAAETTTEVVNTQTGEVLQDVEIVTTRVARPTTTTIIITGSTWAGSTFGANLALSVDGHRLELVPLILSTAAAVG